MEVDEHFANCSTMSRPAKPLRQCCVCGARVANLNRKVTTCDRYCQLAKDYNIDRQRAIRLYPENLDSPRVIGPPVWHHSHR
jgi:predicted nucleic acid-binding Zn ribbon protein